MWGLDKGSFLPLDVQLIQHHLMERLFSSLDCFYTSVKKQLGIFVCIYFWVQYSVPLTYVSIPPPIPHCLDYWAGYIAALTMGWVKKENQRQWSSSFGTGQRETTAVDSGGNVCWAWGRVQERAHHLLLFGMKLTVNSETVFMLWGPMYPTPRTEKEQRKNKK